MSQPSSATILSGQTTKLVLLGAFFVIWLVADLWTKHWADTRLADPRHPIALTADEADRGRTIGELVTERLHLAPGKDTTRTVAHVLELPQAASYTGDTRVFGGEAIPSNTRGFYVFWREDGELAPRRLDRSDRLLANRWLSAARGDADPADVLAAVDGSLAEITVGHWLQERVRRLSDDRIEEVASGRMHPIAGRTSTISPEALAVPGTTYLVEWRQVDVMGDWFKYVYAENQGAAFGFLKGAPPMLRDTIFFSLTVVVLFMILGIIVRTPARHRVVLISLTAILSGAVGNFIDRVRYGYVIDFIDMDLGFYHWPTYNVADIGISCGVVLLMIDITFNKDSPLVTEPEASPPPGDAPGATEPAQEPT
jgi:signal peptidase II